MVAGSHIEDWGAKKACRRLLFAPGGGGGGELRGSDVGAVVVAVAVGTSGIYGVVEDWRSLCEGRTCMFCQS